MTDALWRRAWPARFAALAWPGHPTRWRDVPGRLRPTLVTTFRLTAAAVVAYVLTGLLTEGAVDLTGALTALLVMQASAYSTLKMGAVRVGAVLGGVLIATLLSTWIGHTRWSLGAAIAASLLLAKVLRLGEQALETPISAMLILAVSDPTIAAEVRVLNTFIGAGVGIAFNVLYPPAMPTRPAGSAVRAAAEAIARPLYDAAESLRTGPLNRGQIGAWLGGARTADARVDRASQVVASLQDSRRFNPRAIATADVAPVLASGVDHLESSLLAIRALFVVMQSEVPGGEAPDDPYGEELRNAFAVVLDDVGDCVRGFGDLVVAEAEGREEKVERQLDQSLEVLRETQAILAELITTQSEQNRSSWLLRGSILAAVAHVLAQFDLEERVRARHRWQQEQASKPLAQLPPLVQAALPHPDRPSLRGLGGGTRGL
ncbi:MAG TPA: FUSC family protein [Microlunatus sp.]|nr:FUSC family protein [Microlunatus sp.]